MDSIKTALDTIHCVQKSTGNISTYDAGHSGHSTFIKTLIRKNIIYKTLEVDNEKDVNIRIGETIGQSTVSTVSNISDPRFKSQSFRAAVRTVLLYFGHEKPCYKDFKDVEQKFAVDHRSGIDWIEFAARITNPRFIARVWVLDSMQNRCASMGVTLFGDTKDEALKTLPACYQFERWFE